MTSLSNLTKWLKLLVMILSTATRHIAGIHPFALKLYVQCHLAQTAGVA
jgi:hypothetical protein